MFPQPARWGNTDAGSAGVSRAVLGASVCAPAVAPVSPPAAARGTPPLQKPPGGPRHVRRAILFLVLSLSPLLAHAPGELRSQVSQAQESLPQLIPPEAPTLIDWTPEQVRARPELRKLQFAKSQQDLATILGQAGDRVAAFFIGFPNTTSIEEVQSRPCTSLRGNCAVTFKAKYQYL